VFDLGKRFEEFDVNHDKKLSLEEFEIFIRKIFPGILDIDVIDCFILMDKDYNGSLCIHELMEWNDTKY
jgi:Ca2+-binding EF-hand superfamily protein